eukprot:403365570
MDSQRSTSTSQNCKNQNNLELNQNVKEVTRFTPRRLNKIGNLRQRLSMNDGITKLFKIDKKISLNDINYSVDISQYQNIKQSLQNINNSEHHYSQRDLSNNSKSPTTSFRRHQYFLDNCILDSPELKRKSFIRQKQVQLKLKQINKKIQDEYGKILDAPKPIENNIQLDKTKYNNSLPGKVKFIKSRVQQPESINQDQSGQNIVENYQNQGIDENFSNQFKSRDQVNKVTSVHQLIKKDKESSISPVLVTERTKKVKTQNKQKPSINDSSFLPLLKKASRNVRHRISSDNNLDLLMNRQKLGNLQSISKIKISDINYSSYKNSREPSTFRNQINPQNQSQDILPGNINLPISLRQNIEQNNSQTNRKNTIHAEYNSMIQLFEDGELNTQQNNNKEQQQLSSRQLKQKLQNMIMLQRSSRDGSLDKSNVSQISQNKNTLHQNDNKLNNSRRVIFHNSQSRTLIKNTLNDSQHIIPLTIITQPKQMLMGNNITNNSKQLVHEYEDDYETDDSSKHPAEDKINNLLTQMKDNLETYTTSNKKGIIETLFRARYMESQRFPSIKRYREIHKEL